MNKSIRVRFAPSPTGPLHIGGVRTALFNYLFAKKHGGTFVLRIEDTDQKRFVTGAEDYITNALNWCNIPFDEGPGKDGDFGPYRQSERKHLYKQYVDLLIENNKAYYAFDTAEALDLERKNHEAKGKTFIYNWHNRTRGRLVNSLVLSKEEVAEQSANGEDYVVRFLAPQDETLELTDLIRGTIAIDTNTIDDKVLFKSDCMPTYHLANVVDAHRMGITHVIRGEEWVTSAPKQKLRYHYFGWDMPELCHLPLLRNPDKSKLSKRKNPTSILHYERMGFLPEALVNYLGRMGWSMPDEREKFSLEEMQAAFDIDRVSLGGPIFDVEKLKWLNGTWLREDFDAQTLKERLKSWLWNDETLDKILPHAQGRMDVMSDFIPMSAYLLSGEVAVTAEAFDGTADSQEELLKRLQFVLWRLEAQQDWERGALFAALKGLADTLELKPKVLFAPLFVAISGKSSAYSIPDSMSILGPDLTRARLRNAISVLGGVSKKAAKRLEKEYAALA